MHRAMSKFVEFSLLVMQNELLHYKILVSGMLCYK